MLCLALGRYERATHLGWGLPLSSLQRASDPGKFHAAAWRGLLAGDVLGMSGGRLSAEGYSQGFVLDSFRATVLTRDLCSTSEL